MKHLFSWVTHNVQVKITFVVFFTAFVASLVNYQVGLRATKSALLNGQQVELVNKVEKDSGQLEAFLRQIEDDLILMSELPSVHAIMEARGSENYPSSPGSLQYWHEQLTTVFERRIRARPHYLHLGYFEAGGSEIVGVAGSRVPPQIQSSSRNRIENVGEALALNQGEVFASEISFMNEDAGNPSSNGIPVISYATPIYDDIGVAKGVLLIDVNGSYLVDSISRGEEDASIYTFLVNQEGYYLSHPDPAKVWGKERGHGSRFDLDYAEVAGSIYSGESGFHSSTGGMFAYAPVRLNTTNESTYWVEVKSMPKGTAFAAAKEYQRTSLMLFGGALLLTVGIGVWMAGGWIVKPIRKLQNNASKIADGDYNVSALLGQNDEVGKLSESFDSLVTKVRKNVKNVEVIIDLTVKMSRENDVKKLLQAFLKEAREITHSKYAAISTVDRAGNVKEFLTLGISKEIQKQIGRLPEGKGLLGHVHHKKETLRLERMRAHPSSVGFPENHPPMDTLLATPILFQDRLLGMLYLSTKEDDSLYTKADERLITDMAAMVGVLIDSKETSNENRRTRTYLQEETNKLVKVIGCLAEGDFTVDIDTTDHGDGISHLKQELAQMVKGLKNLIEQVREAVRATYASANQINEATEQLAVATQQQSVQAQDVANSVDEMAQTITDNARNATETATVSYNSGKAAHDGGEIVQQSVEKIREIAKVVEESAETIERLGESSQKIGDIVAVIEEIADQTNLLALNAAIEAARAGEQGKGFAVVADEVRKLAERTTGATTEIGSMIKTIQSEANQAVNAMRQGREEVASGLELADRAGDALTRVVEEMNKIVDRINQIAVASEEQSSTSTQISMNVEAISTVTNESAKGVTEISIAAQDLEKYTEDLRSLISRFKIDAIDVVQQEVYEQVNV
ncbi:MAG: GAF domain-containing protein [Rhodothermaceae bacterium]|nr:GAF domain-containing protein [Rhodothermaceae bacterium]